MPATHECRAFWARAVYLRMLLRTTSAVCLPASGLCLDGNTMRTAKRLVVALYAVVLVLAPFTHHDLACHLKDPQHCTACTSTQALTDPATVAAPSVVALVDVGRAVSSHSSSQSVLLTAHSTGRSPP